MAIQVHAERAALVTWWANPEPDIAGYVLCYGPSEQSFGKTIDVGNVTNVVVSDLVEGITYYFAVKAYNTSGLYSDLSDPVSLTVPPSGVPAGTPVVGTDPALGTLATFSTLVGTVNPHGASTTAWFEYGLDTNYDSATPPINLGGTNGVTLVKATVTGLEAGLTYHYRIVAGNRLGTNAGADLTFATQILPANLMVFPVNSVTGERANFNALVDPQGSDTFAWFEYGYDGQTNVTKTVTVSGKGAATPISISVSGLQPSTTYTFRLKAMNTAGTVTSLDFFFMTGQKLVGRSIILYWPASADLDVAGYLIEYAAAGTEFLPPLDVGLVTNYVFSGLSEGITYVFNVTPYDSFGNPLMETQEKMLTIPVGKGNNFGPPIITENWVEPICCSGVVVWAVVNPGGVPTSSWVEYGTDTNFSFVTAAQSLGNGFNSGPFNISVDGLLPGTAYYYRLAASNMFDLVYSRYMVWTNEAMRPMVINKPVEMRRGIPLVSGTVNPNGSATSTWFEYGLDQNYGQVIGLINVGSGYMPMAVRQNILALLPGCTYHFRLVAENSGGKVASPDATFSTPAVPPNVNIEQDVEMTSHTVMVHGTVNPGGAATVAWFEYGPDHNFGLVTGLVDLPASNSDYPLSAPASDLYPGQTYYFRLVAYNSAGGGPSAEMFFSIPPERPTVTANPAENVTGYRATLKAVINPNGAATIAWISYGTNHDYGLYTPLVQIDQGPESVPLSFVVTNLLPSTTYFVRVMAFNDLGTTLGDELTFVTAATAVEASTLPATEIGCTNAVLNGEIAPHGQASAAWFEYGLDATYGFRSSAVPVAADTNSLFITLNLTDLSPSQTWHYRLAASNEFGLSFGDDITFTTSTSDLSVSTFPVLEVLDFEATLNGVVNSPNFPAYVFYEYGLSTNYTFRTAVTEFAPRPYPLSVPKYIENLDLDTTYYYRIVASNQFETVYGTNAFFTTPRQSSAWP